MQRRQIDKTLLAMCSAAVLSAAGFAAATVLNPRMTHEVAIAKTARTATNGKASSSQHKTQTAAATSRKATERATATGSGTKVASKTKSKTVAKAPVKGGSRSVKHAAPKQVYKDGTYIGVGETRIGAVQVAVTLKHDRITDVKITGYTTHYPISYIDPILPQELLQRQDIHKIDVVSGATLSTADFYYAVQAALEKAKAAEQQTAAADR